MFKKTVALREKVKLKIALTGPAGSGKTFSALKLAYGITGDWKKITVADTENRSALYYAGERTGEWNHIDFPPTIRGGYHPQNWISLISSVEQDPETEVLILDSISHEWDAKGGALDLNASLGGRFTDWAKVTPLHNAFIDKMRTSRLHIIATMRSKSDFVIEQNEKGKSQPRKIGLKSVQKDGVDYEFGVIFDIDIKHMAESSKDRTGLFADRMPFLMTEETGQELVAWSKDGAERATELGDEEYFKSVVAHATNIGIDLNIFLYTFKEITGRDLSSVTRADAQQIGTIVDLINQRKTL